jgi:uncharacterized protein (TIRG00374 family)
MTAVRPITIAAASRKTPSTVRLFRRPGSVAVSSGDPEDTDRASRKRGFRVNRRIARENGATVAHASSEHPQITLGAILKRLLAVGVAGVALYGLTPRLVEVLGDLPRLRDIEPAWFGVMAVSESASLVCMATVQRIATGERRLAPFLRSYLAGNAVSELLPGGAATSAALQFEMLSQEAVPPARAVSGITAASVVVFGTLLLLNVLGLPLLVLGVAVPAKLRAAAWVSAVLLLGILLFGTLALRGDRFLIAVGRAAQWTVNKVRRSQAVQDLPQRLLDQRRAVVKAVGSDWWQALLAAAGKWVFDYLTLVFALAAVGARPDAALVLVAYSAVSLLGQLPITPGGLGVVEAGLTGALALIGVNGGDAVLATLAYRLFNYWLYLPAGLVGLILHKRAVRAPQAEAG